MPSFMSISVRVQELLRKNRGGAISLPRRLTRHRLGYWRTLECLGGAYHAPLLSREPLFVESRARRHSKALDKTLQNHLSELKIDVTCKVKVRSKVKIRRFYVLGPGDQDYRT